jgi:uncharacterized protein
MNVYEKLDLLKQNLSSIDSLIVAFSGGVDSTFLLKVAHDILGSNAVAVTAKSSMYPPRELKQAVDFAKSNNIVHVVLESEELEIDGFSSNPTNRCYLCKNELYTKVHERASEMNIKTIVEGSNTDDLGDYRPGFTAVKEHKILSPLLEAKMSKEDIRVLSKDMNLPTWDKPAFACLASRFPYGQNISVEKLNMIDKAEQYLFDLGFKQVRVRHHGEIARIEVSPNERAKFYLEEVMDNVHNELTQLGFKYVCLDLKGYRTGSMNEVLGIEKHY